ncbi:hypothetical protein D3C72_2058330 [compost metagenome]
MLLITYPRVNNFIEILCHVTAEVSSATNWHQLLRIISHLDRVLVTNADHIEWRSLDITEECIHQLAKMCPVIILQLIIYWLKFGNIRNCAVG